MLAVRESDVFRTSYVSLKSTKGIKWMRTSEQVGFFERRPQPAR